eukprot:CAMPEP_0119304818 /NCGR_PEP_ID=MMETSP1333-20130426/5946_1 /TAXON_ID=418940 /ORGANISM="Scyphosphaera apsteinii, Strain RCC1455" /LENGTH=334 /DNA_ID=CAMNT_0007307759 /DNA_START=100 /DNA_END=1100 /DNA_ORIENTATION=+
MRQFRALLCFAQALILHTPASCSEIFHHAQADNSSDCSALRTALRTAAAELIRMKHSTSGAFAAIKRTNELAQVLRRVVDTQVELRGVVANVSFSRAQFLDVWGHFAAAEQEKTKPQARLCARSVRSCAEAAANAVAASACARAHQNLDDAEVAATRTKLELSECNERRQLAGRMAAAAVATEERACAEQDMWMFGMAFATLLAGIAGLAVAVSAKTATAKAESAAAAARREAGERGEEIMARMRSECKAQIKEVRAEAKEQIGRRIREAEDAVAKATAAAEVEAALAALEAAALRSALAALEAAAATAVAEGTAALKGAQAEAVAHAERAAAA